MTAIGDRIGRMVDVRYEGRVNRAAKEIGPPVLQRTLARIIGGEIEHPRSDLLQRIAEHFGANLDWIVRGETSGARPPEWLLSLEEERALSENLGRSEASRVAAQLAEEGQRWRQLAGQLGLEPPHYAHLLSLPWQIEEKVLYGLSIAPEGEQDVPLPEWTPLTLLTRADSLRLWRRILEASLAVGVESAAKRWQRVLSDFSTSNEER